MSAGARSYSVQRPKLALTVAAALCAMAVVGFVGFGAEQLWQVHASDTALRSAIETGITLSALVSAVLLLAHFRHTRRLRDLLLLAALATVALTDFVFNALPAYHYETGIYGAGARMALTTLIAGTFLAVAFAPGDREVQAGRRLAGIAVRAGRLFLCGPWRARGPHRRAGARAGPVGRLGPLASAISVACCILLLVSAAGFAVRHRDGDREAGLLAAAAVCVASAQLGLLTVSVAPPGLGHAVRCPPCQRLWPPAGGQRPEGVPGIRSQEQMARKALAAERLRIAHDLHDGLAQDLAFIAAQGERLAREFGADHPLAIAAQRALDASRGKIVDLSASRASSTEQALREVAAEFGSRFDVAVKVDVDPGASAAQAEPSESERHELVRIAREAIANAVRHGGARNVTVRLGSRRDDLLLRASPTMAAASAARTARPPAPGWACGPAGARAKSVGGRARHAHAGVRRRRGRGYRRQVAGRLTMRGAG